MKKVSAKRVWATIGVVVAVITAFVGGVFGVMALMGKFKTPEVFPNVLEFEITEEVVVEKIPFDVKEKWENQFSDPATSPTIESFILKGTNSEINHEVNQKDCYIWFADSASSKLITLCDKDGKPLSKDSKNRYSVKCNEPIYYMVNKYYSDTMPENGKVVLQAKSFNESVKLPINSKTLWIDRQVKSVFVDGYSWSGSSVDGSFKQEISIGTSVELEFDYKTTTEHSLKPFSKESKKEIELYFNVEGMGYGTDYVKVTQEEILNNNSPLSRFFTYRDGAFIFNTDVAGTYYAYIAVFPTYQSKVEYETAFSGDIVKENKNIHRVQHMLRTDIVLTVKEIEVDRVSFEGLEDGEKIVLDLYTNSSVYLNSEAKTNNLGLVMEKGGESTTSRFNQVSMDGFAGKIDEWKTPVFKSEMGDSWEYRADKQWKIDEYTSYNMSCELTNICVAENKFLIDYVVPEYDEDLKMYCSNGVAVMDIDTEQVYMLKSGSYLNFYIQNPIVGYEIANFEYSFEKENSIQDGISFKITTETLPESYLDTLVLGILVVNDSGLFNASKLFATAPVGINEQELVFEITSSEVGLDINYGEENKVEYGEKSFDDIIRILYGSYRACAFVVPYEEDPIEDPIVEIIEGVTFDVNNDGNPDYVLVGTSHGIEGKAVFDNIVKLNRNVTNALKSKTIYMIQLKNGYQQTIEDMIKDDDEDGDIDVISFGQDQIKQLYNLPSNEITINRKHIFNNDLLDSAIFYTQYDKDNPANNKQAGVSDSDGVYQVYENNTNLTVVVEYNHDVMVSNVLSFYDPSYYVKASANNIEVTSITLDGNKITAIFNTTGCLTDPNEKIAMWLEIDSVRYDFAEVRVLSGSPEKIVLKTKDSVKDYELELSGSTEINETNYLKIEVGHNGTEYTYDYYLVTPGEKSGKIDVNHIFNEKINSTYGFMDAVNKGQTLNVVYSSNDEKIINTEKITFDSTTGSLNPIVNLVEKVDYTTLIITIGSKTAYLTVKTESTGFTNSTKDSQTSFDTIADRLGSSGNVLLSEIFYFKHGSDPITTSYDNLVKITDVECVEYGNGILIKNKISETKWTLTKSGSATPILTIENDSTNGWKFVKPENYVTLVINFRVETIAGHKDITLTFSSSISIDLRKDWNANKVFYAGTDVKLYDSTNSVFEITGTSDVVFKCDYMGDIGSGVGYKIELTDDHISDEFKIQVAVNGVTLDEVYVFKVKPNIIATIQTPELTSEKTYNIINNLTDPYIYKLQQFKDVVYGDSATYYVAETGRIYYEDAGKTIQTLNVTSYYYDNQVLYYTDSTLTTRTTEVTPFFKYIQNVDCLIDLTSVSNLSFDYEQEGDSELVIDTTTDDTKFDIGEMKTLGIPESVTIYLVYKGDHIISKETFKINNKYSVTINDSSEGDLTFKALKEYDNFVEVSGFSVDKIEDLNADDATKLTFEIIKYSYPLDPSIILNQTFKISTIITQPLNDVRVKVTFTNGTQTLVFETTINVVPYVPAERTVKAQAYLGAKYDLLNGIFNADDTHGYNYLYADNNIKSLMVEGVYGDATGTTNLTPDLIDNFTSMGYAQGVGGANCAIEFNDISLHELTIYIKYILTYDDNGSSHAFYVKLIVKNRQTISVEYPENDLTLNRTFSFISDYETMSGETVSAGTIKSLTSVKYEPVLVYNDQTTTLNFVDKDNKMVQRAIVENETTNTSKLIDQIISEISLVAYEQTQDMTNFIKGIKYKTNEIILPSFEAGFYGLLIFKLSTPSGNYTYYCVYIYCYGEFDNVNSNNELQVVYDHYNNTELKNSVLKDSLCVRIGSGSSTKYTSLVESLNNNNDMYKVLKMSYTNSAVKVFLYDITIVGVESSSINYSVRGSLTDQTIDVDDKFRIITLGLVWINTPFVYSCGTIKIYVQPNTAIKPSNIDQFEIDGTQTFKYNLPNGYFKSNVQASATSIECPFDGTWTAKILEINDAKYDSTITKHSKYTVSVGNINLGERVFENTEIVVEYTKTSPNETVVYVTYTYLPTEIPNQNILNSKEITIGEFVGGSFKDSIDITDSTNKTTFFGTYNPGTYGTDYTLAVESGDPGHVTLGSNLQFKQTDEDQTIKIEITYINLDNAKRVFTFKVKKGFAYKISGKGYEEENALETSVNNLYTGIVGSTLTIVKDAQNQYTIGSSLSLYTTIDSKLVITVHDIGNEQDSKYIAANYVCNGSDVLTSSTETLTFNANGDINFVHTKNAKKIMLKISIQSTGVTPVEYGLYELYVEIQPTYTELNAVYLTERAKADHENVQNALTITNLSETLINKTSSGTYRFKLKDQSGVDISAELENMGFLNYKNPNFVDISASSLATITRKYVDDDQDKPVEHYGITFSTVSVNATCVVVLKNEVGLYATYTYQIMNGNYVDGIDYSKTNGYHGTYLDGVTKEYVSFMMPDYKIGDYNYKKLVIGQIYDRANNGQFTLFDSSSTPATLCYLVDAGSIVGGYERAVQYKLTKGGNDFYITLDLDTKNVELFYDGNDLSSQIVLNISAGGVNGGTTLFENLEIVLNEKQIEEKYETSSYSIYSGFGIELKDKVFKESTGGSSILTYNLAESEYYYKDINTDKTVKETIYSNDIENNLFKYNISSGILTFEQVGSTVTATINFSVKNGNYVLKMVTFKVSVYRNRQIVVNGEKLIDNMNNTSPETHFILTNNGKAFALETMFEHDYPDSTNVFDGVDAIYYNILTFDIYQLLDPSNTNATETDLKFNNNSDIVVTMMSKTPATDDVKLIKNGSNYGLKFEKDYTGKIELKLEFQTGCGNYYVIWTIHCYGIIRIEKAYENQYNASEFKTVDETFASNTSVKIVSGSKDKDVALLLTAKGLAMFDSSIQKYAKVHVNSGESVDGMYTLDGNNEYVSVTGTAPADAYYYKDGIKVTYSYQITDAAISKTDLTDKKLYDLISTDEYFVSEGVETTEIVNGTNLVIDLPVVPGSSDSYIYYVTYKIQIEYNELTLEDWYVTYKVYNRQNISTYEYKLNANDSLLTSSADINVETMLYNTTGKHYLDLFYYKENLKVESSGEEYQLYLEYQAHTCDSSCATPCEIKRTTIKLKVGGSDEYSYKTTSGGYAEFVDAGNNLAFRYETSSRKLYDSSNALIGTFGQIKNYSVTPSDGAQSRSVFKSDVTNIFEYQSFINTYLEKESVAIANNKTNEKHTFNLIHIDDGRFGIELTKDGDYNAGNPLFNNELIGELYLEIGGIKTITTNTSQNIQFKLRTDSVLEAEKRKTLGSLFRSEYVKNVPTSTEIIGVGLTADVEWVGANDIDVESETPEGRIKISNGTDYNVYPIMKATYSKTGTGTGVPSFCSISEDFYYIQTSSSLPCVVAPQYSASSDTSIIVPYGNELDLANSIRVLNDSTLTWETSSSPTVVSSSIDLSTINLSLLDNYKKENPRKTYYSTIDVVVQVSDVEVSIAVQFKLDDKVKILADSYESLTVAGVIRIPVVSNGEISYKWLETTDKVSITGEYVQSYSDGKIYFNKEEIEEYFRDNSEEVLKFDCTITNNDVSYTLEITINRASSPST